MKQTVLRLVISIFIFTAGVAQASDKEIRIVFDQKPVVLQLVVEHESRIRFPEPVHIEVPERHLPTLAMMQPTPSMVYIKPASAIVDRVRIIARNYADSRVYVLDVQTNGSSALDYRIEAPEIEVLSANNVPKASAAVKPQNPPQVVLTRYASQTLYGPDRLSPTDPNIRRVPVSPTYTDLIRSHHGESWIITPIASWFGYGYYITAVEIINDSSVTVDLDPRRIRGDFSTVTAQHTWLGKRGTLEDRTTLYLVSRQPWQTAVEGLHYGL